MLLVACYKEAYSLSKRMGTGIRTTKEKGCKPHSCREELTIGKLFALVIGLDSLSTSIFYTAV